MKGNFYFWIFVFIFSLNLAGGSESGNFETNVVVIKALVEEGNQISYPISVINLAEEKEFVIEYNCVNNFISLTKDRFFLKNSETISFEIILDGRRLEPGVYACEILIKSGKDKQLIPVLFEVETKNPDFDVSLDVPSEAKGIVKGEELIFNIRVYNLKKLENFVLLNARITNLKGEVIYSENFDLQTDNQIEISKSFQMPTDLENGNYVLAVSASKDGRKGVASYLFAVGDKEILPKQSYYFEIAVSVIIILIVFLLAMNYQWDKKLREATKWRSKIKEINKIKFMDINKKISKLNYQKRLLEIAYKKRYVTKASYLAGRKEISRLISKTERK